MSAAPASSSRPSRVTSESLVSTVTADPSAAGPGRSVSATVSRSGSRSWRIHRCGPGRSGASHRPIAPLPQPRSWMTSGRRPAGGDAGARRAPGIGPTASARSRRSSQAGLTGIASTVITPLPRSRLRRRRRWSANRRATRAARAPPAAAAGAGRCPRARHRSASLSAAASPGGTSRPGRTLSAP